MTQRTRASLTMLRAEIDSAEGMLAMAKVVRDPTTLLQYKESTLQTYDRCLYLIMGTSMSHQEEREVWDRLAPIRGWLEMTGLLKR